MDPLNFGAGCQAESNQNYTRYEAILQPQVILPAQFSGGHHRAAPSEPLRRLMAAILEDGLRCFRKNINARLSRRREFYEAEQWFFGSKAEGPFAFENVCHILDLDPSHLRRTLRDWSASRIAIRQGSYGAVAVGGSGPRNAPRKISGAAGRRNSLSELSPGHPPLLCSHFSRLSCRLSTRSPSQEKR